MARFTSFARLSPFFNRKVELDGLRDLTRGGGRLLLVTGPRDSGKSSLLNEFAARLKSQHEGTPILIDMRFGTMNTAAAFAGELRSHLLPFIAAARSAIPTDAYGSFVGWPAADAFLSYAEAVEKQEDDMTKLLKHLHGLFFSWRAVATRIGHGEQAGIPTLILDEANRLHEWSRDPQELVHLHSLQEFFLKMTKQDGVGNVILGSSEDFFRRWMESEMGPERFMIEVVGDLLEPEAKAFFLSRLEYEGEFPQDLWEEIYGYVGGRIHLLKDAASRMQTHDKLLRERWALFREDLENRILGRVFRGFEPQEIREKWAPDQCTPLKPCWTRESYKAVLEKLWKSEGGMLSEEELVASKCISKAELHSLVMHNFIHYRGRSNWATDVSWYKGSWPAIMSPSKPYYMAIPSALAKLHQVL